ncbi:hypothetical protein [Salinibacillus xinjiangensis]|uniref:Uncharacterized protein n=1 Tax=Salinibacillus xinjiangensis TaxID=1229268 RepID=A0A6G1X2D9_9BACI|nr:hypothetical protein [Salinibacillus xinjiangensis]MRG85055.1 hypothetical protein [Salinibacillus xinjiangensis]
MKDVIMLVTEIINILHDLLIEKFGVNMSDKDLHFWIIGIIGMISFFMVFYSFKLISKLKWHVSILSFIYTFTMMVVLVFAIEIQQAITNRGNKEFADAVIGLWGFIVFFTVYTFLVITIYFVSKIIKNSTYKKDIEYTKRTERYNKQK